VIIDGNVEIDAAVRTPLVATVLLDTMSDSRTDDETPSITHFPDTPGLEVEPTVMVHRRLEVTSTSSCPP